jgi:plastocyanin
MRTLGRACLIGGALVLAGCSGAASPETSSPTTTTTTSAAAPGGSSPAGGVAPAGGVPEVGPGSGDRLVISTFLFRPNPLQAKAGAAITVENRDDIGHTVTSGPEGRADGRFDQPLAGAGATATIRFDQPGTYQVHCELHPGMEATVEVS